MPRWGIGNWDTDSAEGHKGGTKWDMGDDPVQFLKALDVWESSDEERRRQAINFTMLRIWKKAPKALVDGLYAMGVLSPMTDQHGEGH